jgi:hypothetical protein
MDIEKCERLLSDLEEAKGSFDIIIEEMKENGIVYPYDEITSLVNESYTRISIILEKIKSDTPIYENLYEKNKDYLRRLKMLRFSGLLLKLVLFNVVVFLLGKSDNYGIKSTAVFSGIFAWIGTDLVSKDLQARFVDPLKDPESLEYYERLDMERYKRGREAANDIDTINSINRNLWKELDKPRVLGKVRRVHVENELKG